MKCSGCSMSPCRGGEEKHLLFWHVHLQTIMEEPIMEEPIREEPIREEPIREEPIREERGDHLQMQAQVVEVHEIVTKCVFMLSY